MKKYTVAILGATGAVGSRIIKQLEKSSVPVKDLKLLSSKHSAGKTLAYKGKKITVQEATPESFNGVDLVLASAGGPASKKLLPEAIKRGAVAVDNTSAFRMDPNVPLVIPEVNEKDLYKHKGIVSNPNCSTIAMLVALNPIRNEFGLDQIIVSTYQAASGAGNQALKGFHDEAKEHLNGKRMEGKFYPVKGDKKHYPLAFNLLPQIDVFEEDGYSHEEWKMIHETKKIMSGDMDDPKIKVTATCVRVPVDIGHGESIYFKVHNDKAATTQKIRNVVKKGPSLVLEDNPKEQIYPQPIKAAGKEETFVGRIRPDLENKGSYNMWVVTDNLLKGAAANTVQIAERLVADDLVRVPKNNLLSKQAPKA